MNQKVARWGVLILIVLGSLYGSLRNLAWTADLGGIHQDPVAEWEDRFERLKLALPFTRGFVGYISDADIPGVEFSEANDQAEYVLTQYVMAPIILIRGTGQEWNIGNLGTDAFRVWKTSINGRFEIIPFGGGLYLIHKTGP